MAAPAAGTGRGAKEADARPGTPTATTAAAAAGDQGRRAGSARGLAAASYLPVPGLGLLLARLAPSDRLARFHGRQGGWLSLLLVLLVLTVGWLSGPLPEAAMKPVGMALAVAVLAGLALMARGAWGALNGRFPPIRFLWPLCRLGEADAQQGAGRVRMRAAAR